MVTAAEADRVIAENKVIDANLDWRFERNAYRLTVDVMCQNSSETLTLHGTVGKKNRSFVLLYGNAPIRKYTVHDRHTDSVTRITHTKPHKHFWDDVWQDRRVYIPDDIRIGNPNEELMDFLNECNISLRGSYTPQNFRQLNQGGRR